MYVRKSQREGGREREREREIESQSVCVRDSVKESEKVREGQGE